MQPIAHQATQPIPIPKLKPRTDYHHNCDQSPLPLAAFANDAATSKKFCSFRPVSNQHSYSPLAISEPRSYKPSSVPQSCTLSTIEKVNKLKPTSCQTETPSVTILSLLKSGAFSKGTPAISQKQVSPASLNQSPQDPSPEEPSDDDACMFQMDE